MTIPKRMGTEEILDRALDAAEGELRQLLGRDLIGNITHYFMNHCKMHLEAELQNIVEHGHRNDDLENVPPAYLPPVRP